MKLPTNQEFLTGFSWKQYTTVRTVPLKELNARYVEIRHIPTGATIVHIQNEDPENLFCLSFRTLPPSSNGIAHILEHTVLCGSKKFPVRDPFFSMRRRSLHTFMNALTGSDFTCYPAASQLEKDFYNLLEVYIDAVFFPNLNHVSFLQEGHRLEFEQKDDPTTPLIRKGVVYNEMKGALSSPLARLHEKLSSLLFPDVPYGFNSGGEVQDIPSLTLEQLKEFHQTAYHPSRCLFYFYGSFSLAKHLEFLDKQILQQSSALDPFPPLPTQPRFKKPRFETMHYPASKTDLRYAAISWLTYPCADVHKMLELSVLDALLMETDASPLKRAILESKLAKQTYSSLQTEIAEASYSLILTGTTTSAKEAQKQVFLALKKIAKNGFQKKEIERVLHQIELQRREISRESSPFGLTLFWRGALLLQQGIDPIAGFEIDQPFSQLRKKLRHNPRYFNDLIEDTFLHNQHMVALDMKPSPTIQEKENKEERKALEKIQKNLSHDETTALLQQAKKLHSFQNQKKEDLSCLPCISVQDISRKSPRYTVEKQLIGPCECFFSSQFTNHVTYIDIACELDPIVWQKSHLVKLYSFLLPQMGYGRLSWDKALEHSQEYTGGVYSSISLHPSVHNPNILTPHFYLHGNCLSKNKKKLFDILVGYLRDVQLNDVTRIEELLCKHRTSLEASLIPSALRYASLEAEKNISLSSFLHWQMSGHTYLEHIRTISSQWKRDREEVMENMHLFKGKLLSFRAPKILVTSEDTQFIDAFFKENSLPIPTPNKKQTYSSSFEQDRSHIAFQSTTPVSFSSLALPAMPYTSSLAPYANLLSPLLNNLLLHKVIREQGGAYGGGSSYNPSQALFSFYTYRDPHIWNSYSTFKKALQVAAKGHFKEEDLNEAKREAIQKMDEPISPASITHVVFHRMLEGKTDTMRQQFRTRLLDATKTDLQQTALFLLQESLPKSSFATVAGDVLLASEKKTFAKHKITLSLRPI